MKVNIQISDNPTINNISVDSRSLAFIGDHFKDFCKRNSDKKITSIEMYIEVEDENKNVEYFGADTDEIN